MMHEDLDDLFRQHAVTPQQAVDMSRVREGCRALAELIWNSVPPCGERISAVRKIQEAMMMANAGIAIHGAHADDDDAGGGA